MRTTVINLRDFKTVHQPDGKWRKGGQVFPPDVVRIDRHTRWGNPYRIGLTYADGEYFERTREEALDLYMGWLAERLRDDPTFLDPLKGKRLACWCAPLPCHGDVIAEVLNGTPRPRAR